MLLGGKIGEFNKELKDFINGSDISFESLLLLNEFFKPLSFIKKIFDFFKLNIFFLNFIFRKNNKSLLFVLLLFLALLLFNQNNEILISFIMS